MNRRDKMAILDFALHFNSNNYDNWPDSLFCYVAQPATFHVLAV